jgi:PAS domain S-box-containing protein
MTRMSPRCLSSPGSRARCVAQIAAGGVVLLCAVALAGWFFNIDILRSLVAGSTPLKPNIAAGFLLSGAALLCFGIKKQVTPVRVCAAAAAVMVIALGAATLGEHFLNWNIGIENWPTRQFPVSMGAVNPARMMPTTAFCFVLMGVALLAETGLIPGRFRYPLVAGLSAALVFIGVLALGGFLLEKALGPKWNLLGMSISGVTAAAGFMILGVGLAALLQGGGRSAWSLDFLTTTGFGVGVLLTVLTASSAFTFAKQMLETNDWVTHRQDVLKEVQHCMTGMAELTSNERVYAILGNVDLLKGREQITAAVQQDLRDVRRLTADNPNQQRRLDKLEPLIGQQIDWEEKVIAARRAQGAAAAVQMIAEGRGLGLSAEIAAVFKQLQDEEYGLLGTDRKRAKAASVATFLLLPLGVFVSISVLSLGVFSLNAGVSEQKHAENALRQSEAQLQTIVENLDEGLVVSDLNGQLLQWNRAALRLHGYSRSEQDRRRFTDLTDTFQLSTLEGAILPVEDWPLARILRGELLQDLELRVNRLGTDVHRIFNYGGTIVHDANGSPLMAIVTIGDITDRKEADEKLRSSEKRYRRLFEANPNPMWVYDLETLSFLAVNDAAVRHYGYSRKEFLVMTIKDIRPPEDVPALVADVAGGTSGLDEVAQWRHRKKNGELIEVEITSHSLEWLGHSARLVLVNDITQRNRVEREIRQLNIELDERVQNRTAELEAANKELEAFSYSVSHDLRAPLRAVDGFSQAVLEDYGAQLPSEGRHYLRTIRQGAQRMGVLIDDLLTFSRLSRLPLNKQPIKSTRLVRDVLAELQTQQNDRKIDIRVGELAACEGDPALLKQVWTNFLSNALKYTRKREQAIVEIGSKPENGEMVYFVRDNGAGFDMRYAGKLFGVFQRLHRADEFEGTGVGLAIAQRVIHRHGGRVWAEGAVDRGATFYFTMKEPNNV